MAQINDLFQTAPLADRRGTFLEVERATPDVVPERAIAVMGIPGATPDASAGAYCTAAPAAIRNEIARYSSTITHYNFDLGGALLGVRRSRITFFIGDKGDSRVEHRFFRHRVAGQDDGQPLLRSHARGCGRRAFDHCESSFDLLVVAKDKSEPAAGGGSRSGPCSRLGSGFFAFGRRDCCNGFVEQGHGALHNLLNEPDGVGGADTGQPQRDVRYLSEGARGVPAETPRSLSAR